ncbi:hypothetical protein V1525DRAFT_395262 [Lipomyces kononenkoae]|uniref:Uncharacterized protein n=1 Tax=Lipomyces kononenkoae TaxID=34357 RepID=A0ACC3TCA4_LIPKO
METSEESPQTISLTPSSHVAASLEEKGKSGNTHEARVVAGASWPLSCEAPVNSSSTDKYVWLIFGATGTIGRHICRAALERGDTVMACSRNIQATVTVSQAWSERLLISSCDVRSRPMVKESVDKTVECYGRIDVVVNCVAIGVSAPCEEQDENDVRAQFETNVMGLFHIVQTTLPLFRQRNGGKYIMFSSIAGMLGIPGLGPFSGTKWATEGFVESLSYEIEEFGAKATLVYPGPVQEAETRDKRSPPWRHFVIKPLSNEYLGTPAEHARRMILWVGGHRTTSVEKIGEILWQLAHSRNPPMRLLLGSEAVESMRDKLRQTIEEVEDWKFLFTSDGDNG